MKCQCHVRAFDASQHCGREPGLSGAYDIHVHTVNIRILCHFRDLCLYVGSHDIPVYCLYRCRCILVRRAALCFRCCYRCRGYGRLRGNYRCRGNFSGFVQVHIVPGSPGSGRCGCPDSHRYFCSILSDLDILYLRIAPVLPAVQFAFCCLCLTIYGGIDLVAVCR